jgi:hypothetical protein
MATLKRLVLDYLIIGEPDECWSWNHGVANNGYVYLRSDHKDESVLGHRVVAEVIFGDLGKNHVHHTCENKTCGNPAHLRLLSERDHHLLHAKTLKCKHGDEFRRTKKNGKTYCAKCQSERYRRWYYERGGQEWFKQRNKTWQP